jgi:uncharacterized peroxidase-related enzyme
MAILPSMPAGYALADLFQGYPKAARPLLEMVDVVMRGPSPFSVAERELIAGYVSGLNQCDFCHDSHVGVAEAYGIAPEVMARLMTDVDSAPVDERLKPGLAYGKKLTLTPSRMVDADAQAIYDAGWDERAVHDAALVCATFNYMNRLVDGTGINIGQAEARAQGRALRDMSYRDFGREIGIIDSPCP